MTTVYVLNIHREYTAYTSVFSTNEKAETAIVDYCRKHWREAAIENEEMPTNDDDMIGAYYDLLRAADSDDWYAIVDCELDLTYPFPACEEEEVPVNLDGTAENPSAAGLDKIKEAAKAFAAKKSAA
jgi:hypothetical protein